MPRVVVFRSSAGLARDKSAAALVNVVPGDEPQDAYKVIAESAKPFITTPVKELIDRKVTKRTVMTVPYNSNHSPLGLTSKKP